MFGIDVTDGRAPIAFKARREKVLFKRDLVHHVTPRSCGAGSSRRRNALYRMAVILYQSTSRAARLRGPSSAPGAGRQVGASSGHHMRTTGTRASSDKSGDKNGDKSQVQVIARAAAILRILEDEADGLSLGQIAQRVDLARSTVQRIVGALAAEKFVIAASPNGRVRLGPPVLGLPVASPPGVASPGRPSR